MTAPTDLAHVEPGTVLRLAEGEWSGGYAPAVMPIVLRVARVHTDRPPETPPGLWVSGHMVECTWGSVEEHDPCTQVYVYLDPPGPGPAAGRPD